MWFLFGYVVFAVIILAVIIGERWCSAARKREYEDIKGVLCLIFIVATVAVGCSSQVRNLRMITDAYYMEPIERKLEQIQYSAINAAKRGERYTMLRFPGYVELDHIARKIKKLDWRYRVSVEYALDSTFTDLIVRW